MITQLLANRSLYEPLANHSATIAFCYPIPSQYTRGGIYRETGGEKVNPASQLATYRKFCIVMRTIDPSTKRCPRSSPSSGRVAQGNAGCLFELWELVKIWLIRFLFPCNAMTAPYCEAVSRRVYCFRFPPVLQTRPPLIGPHSPRDLKRDLHQSAEARADLR